MFVLVIINPTILLKKIVDKSMVCEKFSEGTQYSKFSKKKSSNRNTLSFCGNKKTGYWALDVSNYK